MTEERRDKCEECRYYSGLAKWNGECRRRAPIYHDKQVYPHRPIWPNVYADSWCGEFEDKMYVK